MKSHIIKFSCFFPTSELSSTINSCIKSTQYTRIPLPSSQLAFDRTWPKGTKGSPFLSSKICLPHLPIIYIIHVARVQRRGDRPPPSSSSVVWYLFRWIWGDKEFLSLISGKKWNGSRHLVLWSLGTLTGLRDRVRRLVA